ncbi:MAG: hypothetical protein ACM3PW_00280 [Chlamydiota bacterium]
MNRQLPHGIGYKVFPIFNRLAAEFASLSRGIVGRRGRIIKLWRQPFRRTPEYDPPGDGALGFTHDRRNFHLRLHPLVAAT